MVQGSYEILPMLQEYGSVAVKLYLLRKPVDQSVSMDVSRFAYKSFRLQVDSPTSRSFRLHNQVVSPTRSESIRLHSSRFAYTYKSNCFWKMDEYHCLQLAKHSYLTVFAVNFREISAFDWGGERLVVRVYIGRFKKWEFQSLIT